jgi:nitrogen fixation protein FixH
MSQTNASRELTGRHVLMMLIGFFGIIIAASIVFTTLAVTSFRGEDVEKSYRQGIDYNQTLEKRAAQAAMGWSAAVNVIGEAADRTLVVKVTGETGNTLYKLTYDGHLRHPVDTSLDRPLSFNPNRDGGAYADLSGLYGQWTLIASATDGNDTFDFTYDLDLR